MKSPKWAIGRRLSTSLSALWSALEPRASGSGIAAGDFVAADVSGWTTGTSGDAKIGAVVSILAGGFGAAGVCGAAATSRPATEKFFTTGCSNPLFWGKTKTHDRPTMAAPVPNARHVGGASGWHRISSDTSRTHPANTATVAAGTQLRFLTPVMDRSRISIRPWSPSMEISSPLSAMSAVNLKTASQ